jgi:hypothetical protein
MTAGMVHVTAGMVHITNRVTPGSECGPARGYVLFLQGRKWADLMDGMYRSHG